MVLHIAPSERYGTTYCTSTAHGTPHTAVKEQPTVLKSAVPEQSMVLNQ